MTTPALDAVVADLRLLARIGLTRDNLRRATELGQVDWVVEASRSYEVPREDLLLVVIEREANRLEAVRAKRLELAVQASLDILPTITTAPDLSGRQDALGEFLGRSLRTIQRWTDEGIERLASSLMLRPADDVIASFASLNSPPARAYGLVSFEVVLVFGPDNWVTSVRNRFDLIAYRDDAPLDVQFIHPYEDLNGAEHDSPFLDSTGIKLKSREPMASGRIMNTFELPRRLRRHERHVFETVFGFEHPQEPYYVITSGTPLPGFRVALQFADVVPQRVWQFENLLRKQVPTTFTEACSVRVQDRWAEWSSSLPDARYVSGICWSF